MTKEDFERITTKDDDNILTIVYMDGFSDGKKSKESCNGCKHEPKKDDPYPTPCGECARWWSDNFILKEIR